jgi:hypothetical protein
VTYRVTLRNNETGESRVCVRSGAWDDVADYLWRDGNYACDCNRALFFARAGGEEDPEVKCGTSLFTVTKVEYEGEIVYLEKGAV